MKWDIEEDEIVCQFYLEHKSNWSSNLHVLMQRLYQAGFTKRDEGSVRMRIGNIISLDCPGKGLSNYAKQTEMIYYKIISTKY